MRGRWVIALAVTHYNAATASRARDAESDVRAALHDLTSDQDFHAQQAWCQQVLASAKKDLAFSSSVSAIEQSLEVHRRVAGTLKRSVASVHTELLSLANTASSRKSRRVLEDLLSTQYPLLALHSTLVVTSRADLAALAARGASDRDLLSAVGALCKGFEQEEAQGDERRIEGAQDLEQALQVLDGASLLQTATSTVLHVLQSEQAGGAWCRREQHGAEVTVAQKKHAVELLDKELHILKAVTSSRTRVVAQVQHRVADLTAQRARLVALLQEDHTASDKGRHAQGLAAVDSALRGVERGSKAAAALKEARAAFKDGGSAVDAHPAFVALDTALAAARSMATEAAGSQTTLQSRLEERSDDRSTATAELSDAREYLKSVTADCQREAADRRAELQAGDLQVHRRKHRRTKKKPQQQQPSDDPMASLMLAAETMGVSPDH